MSSSSTESLPTDVVWLDEAETPGQVSLPQGELCGRCGAPLDHDDRFCPTCGATHEVVVVEGAEAPVESKHLKCENCGAEIETQQDQRSYICPFCESTYVLEVPESQDRPSPEFVIGFAVTPQAAEQRFVQWISEKSFFRPADLAHVRPADRLRGVYLPFWHFAMLAHSQWRATIGEHWYRTETYTERGPDGKMQTKTRQVQETEWWPLEGEHHRYYSGYLVSAAKSLNQAEADSIMPFQLAALKRFDPSYLAGWQAEEPSVPKEEALSLCQQHFAEQEKRNVGAFMPGDTHRGLQLETRFSDATSDLCLLPVYMMNYRYQGKSFRFMINGQTGHISGKRPYSSSRIALAVALGVGGVLVVIGMIFGLMALVGAMGR